MAPNKIIVFEEITKYSRILVKLYALCGFQVYYVRLAHECRGKNWVSLYIEKKWLQHFERELKFEHWDGLYTDKAFENIEPIYKAIKSRTIWIGRMAGLYDDKNIELVFKKKLVVELSRFYYLNTLFQELRIKFHGNAFCFIPRTASHYERTYFDALASYKRIFRLVKENAPASLKKEEAIFPFWLCIRSVAIVLVTHLYFLGKVLGATVLFLFCLAFRSVSKGPDRDFYNFAIMVVALRRQFSNSVQKVDFLIDGISLRNDNTVFLSDKKIPAHYRNYLSENKLQYLDGILGRFIPPKKCLLKAIGEFFYLLTRQPVIPLDSIRDSVFESVIFYVLWSAFTSRVKVENLITHHDFNTESVCRNIVFKKNNPGFKSWVYMDALTLGCFYRNSPEAGMLLTTAFMFLYYDRFVSWSLAASDYIKMHNSVIGSYALTGCLWAEHVNLIRQGDIKSDLRHKLKEKGYRDAQKLVVIFDASYNDDSIMPYAQGIKFISDIIRLSEDIPDAFFIFKEKKSRDFIKKHCPPLAGVYESLGTHPRFYLPPDASSTSEAIAFSDLAISFAYTSTTIEALAAGKRGIFHDPSGSLKSAYYDTIPGLVCHDYASLLTMTKHLLFELSQAQYNEYLQRHIKGVIEPFLDGKGITRMRSFMTGCGMAEGLSEAAK